MFNETKTIYPDEEDDGLNQPDYFYYHHCLDCDVEISKAEYKKYSGLCKKCAETIIVNNF